MKTIIGLPVYDRSWILPDWLSCIEQQTYPMSKIGFIFITAGHDPETIKVLVEWKESHPEVFCFDIISLPELDHSTHPEGTRMWSGEKYKKMAKLRNYLLDAVCCRNPDRFFSLDSDILLEDKNTLRYLLQLSVFLPAVTPLLYMTPQGTQFPSTMSWENKPGLRAGRSQKYPIGTVFQTDIIMAAKMMKPEVFQNVRYDFHEQGEDLAWSANATALGIPLYLASSVYCPHIMSRSMLEDYKMYGDRRKSIIYGV